MLQEIKTLILPSKSELFLWPAVGLLLLVVQNVSKYWQYLSGIKFEDVKNQTDFALQIQNWILEKEAGIDPRIADFFVWVLIGMIAISVILFIQSSIRNADDERTLIEHMRNPSTKAHELEVFAIKIAVRVGAFIGLLVYFRIFIGELNPGISKLFFTSTLSLNDPVSWLWIVITVLAMGLAIYIFALFIRIIALKNRIF